ncbi:acyl-CoA thioesterase [Geomobilimonas luticola]|uniref:Acyl-CoA thioesterase n=1 Tax=Geomobilimonas luticola TaxID=1114878 RepID=A0ABS5SAI2_9BACT|nr:thioesterase family protein [Geomobilimonas luticola]MBT0652387.1 acyl-CoA thioesterase [Geomobilimonas luticola]
MTYHETPIKVRFNEVDAYRVAWHGHYVTWMEVGRSDLAGRFGLNAFEIEAAGYQAPVVELELKFKRPLRYDEEARVMTTVRRTETATLEFVCRIVGSDGIAATGRTVHVLTDPSGVLQYTLPPVIGERLERLMAYLEV